MLRLFILIVIITIFNLGMDVDEKAELEQEEEEEEQQPELRTYLPGQPLEEGEQLEADQSVYVMLHNLDVRAPFLSFDVLQDSLGEERKNVRVSFLFFSLVAMDKVKVKRKNGNGI